MILQFPSQKKEYKRTPIEKMSTEGLVAGYALTMATAVKNTLKETDEKRKSWINYANLVLIPEIRKRIPLVVERWEAETNSNWAKLSQYYKTCIIKAIK